MNTNHKNFQGKYFWSNPKHSFLNPKLLLVRTLRAASSIRPRRCRSRLRAHRWSLRVEARRSGTGTGTPSQRVGCSNSSSAVCKSSSSSRQRPYFFWLWVNLLTISAHWLLEAEPWFILVLFFDLWDQPRWPLLHPDPYLVYLIL